MILKIFIILFVVPVIFILSGCTQVQKSFFTPSDIEMYCRKIFSDPVENDALSTCIQQERDAKDKLSGMIIPKNIDKRCRQLSSSTGGSYQVMLTCVQKEMPGKNR
jgi:hypothetical protein